VSGPSGFDDARRNRRSWDEDADSYQAQHEKTLSGRKAFAWGAWRLPEDDVGLLGDVAGKEVLELGCGGAQWSIALSERGAWAVGLDNSAGQLRHARHLTKQARARVPLVQSAAESVPFVDESFDIVLSDYGATLFADPYATVPESARILRPRGLFVFTTSSPFLDLFWDDSDKIASTMQRPYFGLHRFEWPEEDTVEFNLPYGEWIQLFRRNRFTVEDLIEVRPPKDAPTTYEGRPLWWARKWPTEIIWKLSKEA
jgi:SAM-dependent methyltransferase